MEIRQRNTQNIKMHIIRKFSKIKEEMNIQIQKTHHISGHTIYITVRCTLVSILLCSLDQEKTVWVASTIKSFLSG